MISYPTKPSITNHLIPILQNRYLGLQLDVILVIHTTLKRQETRPFRLLQHTLAKRSNILINLTKCSFA